MRNKGTYIKVVVLMAAFSLNSLISTACAFSSLFHQLHHHAPDTTEHQHANGEKHSHAHSGNHHPGDENRGTPEDCCARTSVAFNSLDKWPAKSLLIWLAPVFSAPVYDLSNWNIQSQAPVSVHRGFDRWRPPGTIHELRIIIRSFQI